MPEAKTIQIIFLGENYVFLYGLNETNQLVFRTSTNVSVLHEEPFTINNNMIVCERFFFPAFFLARMIKPANINDNEQTATQGTNKVPNQKDGTIQPDANTSRKQTRWSFFRRIKGVKGTKTPR